MRQVRKSKFITIKGVVFHGVSVSESMMSTINTLYSFQHESGLWLQLQPAHPEVVLCCHMALCDNCRHIWPGLMWQEEIICCREPALLTSSFPHDVLLQCLPGLLWNLFGCGWSKLHFAWSDIWQKLEEMMNKTAAFWKWCLIGVQEKEGVVFRSKQGDILYVSDELRGELPC